MHNDSLAADYIRRAGHRLAAVQVLLERESWADVVRESQEIVEIALKGLLRANRIDVPRIHDVSSVLDAHRDRLISGVGNRIDELGACRALPVGTAVFSSVDGQRDRGCGPHEVDYG